MMNMTLTEKQLKILPKLKTELAYSKVEHLLSVYYENQLKKEVSQIFSETRYEVIRNLTEYYDSDIMFQAHMDLILAPIHEVHKKYYETLLKYKIREFDKSRDAGKRIVERTINFRRKGNVINKQFTVLKADINDMVSSTISKDKLFGTSEIAHNNLASRTYTLSEKTLSRVDNNINDIITKGYEEGWGVNKVAHEVNTRFNQLETWESSRIARTEIHNSHSLGLIQGYDDMGVEYIQWSAANDNRTRDTHINLDGEIIPLGGVFSNGLMYPGDMLGSAEEVINCRCQALPYIIPYGFIAPPDMAQFREDDLIATLDYFNADEIITQATAEVDQIPDYVMKPINGDVLKNFNVKSIPNLDTIANRRHPIPITDETIKQYPKDFLLHRYYDFENYSSTIAKHYESYYTEEFMARMKTIIPGNDLPGTRSIYESFKYGCGNNFGRLNVYYRDASAYIDDLRKLGSSEAEIRTITERYDKIRVNLLEGMKQGISLTEDTFTYRATSTNHEIPTKVGQRGVFKGFTSFSFDRELPLIYYQKNSKKYNVWYNVLNPKGTRGMALESSDKFTNTNGQAELLLPETEYEIVYAVKDGNNYWLTVKLINQII